MNHSAALQQLEAACADFQVNNKTLVMKSTNLIKIPAKRAAAEQTLMEFKRTPNILPTCQYILGKRYMDYAIWICYGWKCRVNIDLEDGSFY
jgi:hypothetical protein